MNSALRMAGPRLLTGLIGRDILASRSPWLHESEAAALDLHLTYALFDFTARQLDDSQLPAVLHAAATLGFAGVNITHPFKQAAIAHLDALSDGAAQVGAVNTVSFAGGKLTGYNTDVTGFAESFARGLPGTDVGNVVQFGAGGGGSATASALLSLGAAKVLIADPNASRAAALVAKLAADFGGNRVAVCTDVADAMRNATGLVNATPIGMNNYPGTAFPVALLRPAQWVADIVYFPLETELLRAARALGCRTLNGGDMAVFQAASAFEIFTGHSADRDRMRGFFVNFAGGSATQPARSSQAASAIASTTI